MKRARGDCVVVEEKMTGPEISVFALSDGYSTVLLPPCQDHKKIGEGETGLNTGGMLCFILAIVINSLCTAVTKFLIIKIIITITVTITIIVQI